MSMDQIKADVAKLSPQPGDLLMITVPTLSVEMSLMEAVAEVCRRYSCNTIIMPPGNSLSVMDDDSLAKLGLCRLPEPTAVVEAPQ